MKFLTALSPSDHESRLFQHLQVLHDPKAGHLEFPLELAQRLAIALMQQIEQESARCIRQSLEHEIVAVHGENICDHLVTCQRQRFRRGKWPDSGILRELA